MEDCNKLRAMVSGLPACCQRCHGDGNTLRVKFAGERLRICCTLVAEVIGRDGALLDVDGPVAPRFATFA